MPRVYLTLLRACSIFFSGIAAVTTANLIINIGGTSIYSQYTLLTGISSLLPFIDLGVGYKVNSIMLDNHAFPNRELRSELNRCFTVLVGLSLIFSAISLLLFMNGNFRNLTEFGILPSDQKLVLFILFFTFFNVPLSIGSRILFANGEIARPILYSIAGSIFSIISLVLLWVLPTDEIRYLSLIPILMMNLVNLALFRHVQTRTNFAVKIDRKLLDRKLFEVVTYGLQASMLISLLPITLQLPKYFLGSKGLAGEVANYSIFLLFLQPLVAVASFTIFADLPRIRSLESATSKKVAFLRVTTYAILIGLLSSLILIAITMTNLRFPIMLPSGDIMKSLLILVPLITVKQFFISLFTKPKNMNYLILANLLSVLIAALILIVSGDFSAKSGIMIFLIADSVISVVFSLFFLNRHLLILEENSD
jgi:O-antigen/teichoic acid export membrane protein